MRILLKTSWLLSILVIGLAVLVVKAPASTWHQALAEGPPITGELQTQIEDAQPLAYPALAELVAEEPNPPGATVQLDASNQGTY